eukprot:gene15329-biopygen2154
MWHHVTRCGAAAHIMWHHVTSCGTMWNCIPHHVTSCGIMWNCIPHHVTSYHVASCGIDRDATAGGSIPHNAASCDMYAAMWHLALHDVTSMGHNMEHRTLWITTTTCDAAWHPMLTGQRDNATDFRLPYAGFL